MSENESLNTSLHKFDYDWNDDEISEINVQLGYLIDDYNNVLGYDAVDLKSIYSIKLDLQNQTRMFLNHSMYIDDGISKQNVVINDIVSKIDSNKKVLEINSNNIKTISDSISNIDQTSNDIVSKLNEIEKKSDNEVIKEEFKQLSDDIVTTINNNNTNNISLLVGVIIGISIINVFFHQYSNKL